MTRRSYVRFYLIGIMAFLISLPTWARAGEVGNITQVEQHVDYQKGETGPVIPAKVKQPVEVKDVIQTYEVSRAQVLFRDKTIITIAPKSRIAVESYMFDPAKFERSGDFELIQGVVKIVVPAAEKVQKTSFTLKTSTAVMGIRGTEFLVTAGKHFTVVYPIKDEVRITATSQKPGKYLVGGAGPGEVVPKGEGYLPGTMAVILPNQLASGLPVTPAVLAAAEALVYTGIDDTPGKCIMSTIPGVDLVAVTKNLLSQGGDLGTIRESLSMVSCDPDIYAYSPPGPPETPAGLGPSFPGGGGGGGGGGPVVVASPSS